MTSKLTHLDESGAAHMVDVSAKDVTTRIARAGGTLRMAEATLALVKAGDTPKGDVFSTARIAAIQAAKRTADLIPLCHPLPLSSISCDFALEASAIHVEIMVKTTGKTGVEMEALTGASVALLTLYDMLKAVDKDMVIDAVTLLEKRGGKSGDYLRDGGTR